MTIPTGRIKIFLGIMTLGMSARASTQPSNREFENPSALKPCPRSPNCLSSQDPHGKRYILPLAYSTDPDVAYQALIAILDAEKRATIVARKKNYIHAEFVSRIFRFVDDVEFLFEPDQSVAHVRSASRTGSYDFGANRRRIEHLRRLFGSALEP